MTNTIDQKTQDQLNAIFSKTLRQHLEPMQRRIAELENQLTSANADLIALSNRERHTREAQTTGRGRLTTFGDDLQLTDDEKAEGLQLKLAETSLEDTAKLAALAKGINPNDKAAFERFMGIDDASLEEARERRLRGVTH